MPHTKKEIKQKILKVLRAHGPQISDAEYKDIATSIAGEILRNSALDLCFAFICKHYNVGGELIKSKTRVGEVVLARQIFIALAMGIGRGVPRVATDSEIEIYINRGHSTCQHVKRIKLEEYYFIEEYEVVGGEYLEEITNF